VRATASHVYVYAVLRCWAQRQAECVELGIALGVVFVSLLCVRASILQATTAVGWLHGLLF
jgi:hypothetical protein